MSSWLLLRYSGAVCTGRAVHPRAQCIRYDDPFVMGSVTPMAIPFISYLRYDSWFLCSVRYTGSLGVSSLRGYR